MSNQGSRAFYNLINKIQEFLQQSPDVNTITYGDITQIDLSKQEIYPLAHIMVNNAILQAGVIQFSCTILCMDGVWNNKINPTDQTWNETLYGITNEIDVLNTQLKVVNLLNQSMLRYNLRSDLFELVGDGSCEPFHERFENDLAGWAYNFDVFVQNDINVCQT
jgi:hypothetical protein